MPSPSSNHAVGADFEGPSASACLLSWKRPQNLQIVVQALRRIRFIDEILIWNNDPETRLQFSDPAVRVIQSPNNYQCFGRFLCAALARNSVIYVQDDDALNHDVAGLYRVFLSDPTRIAHALTPQHWRRRERHIYGESHMAFLGWGAFLRQEWLAVLEQLPPTIFEDSLFLREADKFFTMLLARRHNTVLGNVTHLEGHSEPGVALWREPIHRHMKGLAVRQALRELRLRRNPSALVPWNVVIPCHNYGRYLREAVESVLASDADYEIHIVDDASTDETSAVAIDLAAQFPHIHYLRNPRRRGPGYSRNRGVAAAPSDFVVLLDADDRIGPSYLYEAGRMLAEGADVVNPDAILFEGFRSLWEVPEVTTLEMLLRHNFVHTCAAFRRSLWSEVGGIDQEIPRWMDYDFWIRLAAAGAKIQGLHGGHFFYRQHEDSLTQSGAVMKDDLRKYLRRKHVSLYRAQAQL